MSEVSGEFIEVTHRDLPYSTFDADNHLYENQEAMTKFVPREYDGIIRFVEVNGRTKLALRNVISDYIPNPTFAKVARPGAAGFDVTQGGKGMITRAGTQVSAEGGKRMLAMPSIDAFFDPEPRLVLMKEMGIDRTILWPTLCSILEERLADDPDAVTVLVHAFNEWMHEHWSYVYEDAIYCTPLISLANGNDVAIRELELLHDRGAKIFLIRVAPVPTWKGRKSFALPEFDPFWERVQELDMVVGMHAGDPGYTRYTNEWEGINQEYSAFSSMGTPGFLALASEKNALIDALASIIGHGLATRFPGLKFMPVEYSAEWIRPFYAKLQQSWDEAAVLYDEDPVAVFNRNIYVHAFHEADPQGLIDLGIPADRLMFGSDFPHPEGMADPLAYSEVVAELSPEAQALIMGGTIEQAMGVGAYAS
jgi:predicted TIM-barrel fold metal-dependent hydrolase